MNLRNRIKKERFAIPLMRKGYSRSKINAWYEKLHKDEAKYKDIYSKEIIDDVHKRGFLCSSIEKYGLLKNKECQYISDLNYFFLSPYNNSFSKWLDDILTTSRILKGYAQHGRQVYFSVIQRDGQQLILKVDHEDREYSSADVLGCLRTNGHLELRPSYWNSKRKRYQLEYENNTYYVNGRAIDVSEFEGIINGLKANYVITDAVNIRYKFSDRLYRDHMIKFWITNGLKDQSVILDATIAFFWNDTKTGKRNEADRLIDLSNGSFIMNGERVFIPAWDKIRREICEISNSIQQVSYYSVSIALQENGPFKFLSFSANPVLPKMAFHGTLNNYLKARVSIKNERKSICSCWKSIKAWLWNKLIHKFSRRGIRPYMQNLWIEAVKSDFLHTRNVSLPQKIWAWKKGFISYHTYQYNMTKDNYTSFLSDYDYYWLNRINNDYQKWVNDKTTYRLIMEPYREYVPEYYYSCLKRDGVMRFFAMSDCPEDFSNDIGGVLSLLKEKKKLALKPSAGTHGDGFYCLSYENAECYVNGKKYNEEDINELFNGLKSFYVITEYLEMHQDLKKIYSKSVNTVRMMVINRHGYDPKIMQTYMRIGSSKTGYTDNVGYGGICVMVNTETGELYQPETIKDHCYYDCPAHPDTGTPICGILPNWGLVCKRVLDVSRYLCELEYLGFDVAITENGFCILEINIHQDLHKVAMFSDEVMDFYRGKIKNKRRAYGYSELT